MPGDAARELADFILGQWGLTALLVSRMQGGLKMFLLQEEFPFPATNLPLTSPDGNSRHQKKSGKPRPGVQETWR